MNNKRAFRRGDGRNFLLVNGKEIYGSIADYVAAYESTGLTPDEIKRLQSSLFITRENLGDTRRELQKTEEQLDEYRSLESAGKLIEIPCPIGTHLWRVTRPYRQMPKVTEYVVKNIRTAGKKHTLQLEVQAVSVPVTNWMDYSSFRVTREEAEEDLKKVMDDYC